MVATLEESFRSPESRVSKTIVAIDIVGSTKMKADRPEADWVTTIAWLYDLSRKKMAEHSGDIVKFLGDGVMAVFSDENGHDAINWAIDMQEAIAEAKSKNQAWCECSVGIAHGEVFEFSVSPDGVKDYLGTVVDKAFRLCGEANAYAIFVDTDTVSASLMTHVRSRAGLNGFPAPRRARDYQGLLAACLDEAGMAGFGGAL